MRLLFVSSAVFTSLSPGFLKTCCWFSKIRRNTRKQAKIIVQFVNKETFFTLVYYLKYARRPCRRNSTSSFCGVKTRWRNQTEVKKALFSIKGEALVQILIINFNSLPCSLFKILVLFLHFIQQGQSECKFRKDGLSVIDWSHMVDINYCQEKGNHCFSVNFCETFQNSFFYSITRRLLLA